MLDHLEQGSLRGRQSALELFRVVFRHQNGFFQLSPYTAQRHSTSSSSVQEFLRQVSFRDPRTCQLLFGAWRSEIDPDMAAPQLLEQRWPLVRDSLACGSPAALLASSLFPLLSHLVACVDGSGGAMFEVVDFFFFGDGEAALLPRLMLEEPALATSASFQDNLRRGFLLLPVLYRREEPPAALLQAMLGLFRQRPGLAAALFGGEHLTTRGQPPLSALLDCLLSLAPHDVQSRAACLDLALAVVRVLAECGDSGLRAWIGSRTTQLQLCMIDPMAGADASRELSPRVKELLNFLKGVSSALPDDPEES